MAIKREDWLQINKELSLLYEMHEAAISQTGKCREFNSRASILLQHLEELEAFDMADRVMDLLAGCNPKDTSPCKTDRDAVSIGQCQLTCFLVLACSRT